MANPESKIQNQKSSIAVVGRLAVSTFLAHKVRVVLTVTAIALSISLVVAVTSGYSSFERAVLRYVATYMGSTDALITRRTGRQAMMDEKILTDLRADRDVRTAFGRIETESKVLNKPATQPAEAQAEAPPKPGDTPHYRSVQLIGVRLPDDQDVAALKMEPLKDAHSGAWFTGNAGNVAVIDQEAARLFGLKVGDTLVMPAFRLAPATAPATRPSTGLFGRAGEAVRDFLGGAIPAPAAGPAAGTFRLRVVGIVHKPAILAKYVQTVYLPMRTMQDFLGQPGKINRVMINFNTGVDEAAFAHRWEQKLESMAAGGLKLRLARDARREMDKNLQAISAMSYLGGAVSMIAATFIVFSTLSMGVTERQRLLAMLRAIGALRWQIGTLVIFEALMLALLGAAIGVPLGYLWIKFIAWRFADWFPEGAVLSLGGVLFGAGGSILAALAASFLPAFQAMRVTPLEGMQPLGHAPSRRGPLIAFACGLGLLTVDPLLLNFKPFGHTPSFYAHFFLGIPCLMVGFFLIAPMMVWAVERALGRVVAAAARVQPALLRQQLAGSLWRAAGTAAALMVGLAVLVVLQVQGATLMGGWTLPDKFPDMFILAQQRGLTRDEVDTLRSVPGIKKDEVLPISIVVAGLPANFWMLGAVIPDATMFLGVEPRLALEMMALEFRKGDGSVPSPAEQKAMSEQAVYKLNLKVVTLDTGATLRGTLTTRPAGARVVEWRDGEVQRLPATATRTAPDTVEIPGVARISGTVSEQGGNYVVTARAGQSEPIPAARIKSVQSGRHILVTDEFRQLKNMKVGDTIVLKTGVFRERPYTIAGVVWSPGIDVMVGVFDVGQQFEQRSAATVFGHIDDARDDFGAETVSLFAVNLEKSAGPAGVTRQQLEKDIQKRLGALGLRSGDVREIKARIQHGFAHLLLMVSTVALAAMAVASLGVTNTIMASVRSRRWQLGILRSIGLTRGQLLRMIMAESLLLGLVGTALGLAAGFLMSYDANVLTRNFFGYGPAIRVPWGIISAGGVTVVVVSLLASLWPAISTARSDPLNLLQIGRASA